MPIINITELDNTFTAARTTTDIPLIISMVERPETTQMFPKMYTNVEDFKRDHGANCAYIDSENTKYDSAYIMAMQLIDRNMPVYYGYCEDLADDTMIDYIKDKNEVTIKYICVPDQNMLVFGNGSGEGIDLKNKLIKVSKERGDCILLIDCKREFDYKEILDIQANILEKEADDIFTDHEFASAFVPWHNFNLSTEIKFSDKTEGVWSADLPGSYAYLSALHETTKTANNWLAIAGVTRGAVPGIRAAKVPANRIITNTVANKLQPAVTDNSTGLEEMPSKAFAVNPITKIAPYGSVIWGNRTLKLITNKNLQATHFLNTRNMVSDIKKVAYDTAKTLMFNQNDEVLWLDFLAGVTPFLEQLKAGSGIFDYKLIKVPTSERHRFRCEIRIYPISAVEWFDIAVVASDLGVETEEN